MPELSLLGDFHFLRPSWLWLLLPIALNYGLMMWRTSAQSQWKKLIAPHLLEHLLVGRDGGERVRPEHLITALMGLCAIAVAGPTWEREASPFAEDTAPLVIALDLSMSMNAIDVQPTRLERSKQKIHDLLETRRGARTALVAYAGTAHSVLPLSDDPSIFAAFLDSLDSDLMPVAGKEPVAALELAAQTLEVEEVPGSILFITDGIGIDDAPRFERHAAGSDNDVLVLAVGTSDGGPVPLGDNQFATDASGRRIIATLDREGLEALRSRAGAFVVGATVDNADVERLQRRVQSNLRRAQQADETSRWRDFGYWLTLPIVLLGALWFRRGWTVRWNVLGAVLALGVLAGCAPGIWLTADQQGRRLYEQRDFEEAAEAFEDPMWRGVAYYRAGNFDAAVTAFAAGPSAEASYNLGNAQAKLGNYQESVAAYDQALLDRPDWVEARENRVLVQAILDAAAEAPPQGNPGPPTFDADEVKFDEAGEQGERGEVDMSRLSDEQMTEMWMRRLRTSPAEFLRRRFAIEVVQAADAAVPGGGS